MEQIQSLIRAVPDFPSPGIVFRDITPLLADAGGFALSIELLAGPWRDAGVQTVCAVESRGFIFGAALATALGAGFVPLRKPGKLPAEVEAVTYDLEYGTATLEVHRDALGSGRRVLLVDDVLATGGTAAASVDLVTRLAAELVGCAFLVELTALGGRARLPGQRIHAVLAL